MTSIECRTLRRCEISLAASTTKLTTASRRTLSMSRMSISSLATLGTLLTALGPISNRPVVPTVSIVPAAAHGDATGYRQHQSSSAARASKNAMQNQRTATSVSDRPVPGIR